MTGRLWRETRVWTKGKTGLLLAHTVPCANENYLLFFPGSAASYQGTEAQYGLQTPAPQLFLYAVDKLNTYSQQWQGCLSVAEGMSPTTGLWAAGNAFPDPLHSPTWAFLMSSHLSGA